MSDADEQESGVTRRHPFSPAASDGRVPAVITGGSDRRSSMVAAYVGLARSLARRYANRGETFDDLLQVAMVGLVKPIDRFDDERGVQFSTYATSTITGELKRHFRDHRWGLHVNRSMQERYLRVRNATDDVALKLGRSPTIPEIAAEAGMSDEDVLEAQDMRSAFHLASLDTPSGPDDGGSPIQVGGPDPAMSGVEARLSLIPALAKLTPREREVVRLRFDDELSQSQIGARMGMSQMQVSRLLASACRRMHDYLTS